MGIFTRGDRGRPDRVEPRISAISLENPSTSLDNPDPWLLEWARGYETGTFGPAVNEISAMRVSTVFACVDLMAGLIASAPLNVYKDTDHAGRELSRSHRLYPLLHTAPSPGRLMTSAAWRKLCVYHILLWGNSFSIIRYDNAARVVSLDIVMPWMVDVVVMPDGSKVYQVRYANPDRVEVVPQDDILHFMGPTFDGARGLSRIGAFARDPVALAKVLEEQTGRVHENSARPSGMLTLPPGTTRDGKDRAEAHWNERLTGRQNAGKVVFADKDSVYTPFQMSPEDLNTLEARRYQGADICRFFKTPPHLIGEAAGTSAWGSGIEQLTLGYKQFTLDPQMCDMEAELRLKLFAGGPYYAAFDRAGLVSMDARTAAIVAQTEIQSGVLTINERRRALMRADVPLGDNPLVNATLVTLERANTAPPPPAAAGSPAEPADPAEKEPSDAP